MLPPDILAPEQQVRFLADAAEDPYFMRINLIAMNKIKANSELGLNDPKEE
jgi:hypothetical protein